MRTAIWALQVALFDRLSNDPALPGVYDGEIPTGGADGEPIVIAMPYIVIGEETVSDYSTKTYDGEEITKTIHVFSDYQGRKEVAEVMDLALRAMTEGPFLLSPGFSASFAQREFLEVIKEDSNYHGVMRLRFKITQGG
jgi:hypothetical protein